MNIAKHVTTIATLAAGLAAAGVAGAATEASSNGDAGQQIARYNVLRGYADAKAVEPAAGTAVSAPTHRQHH